MNRLHKTESVVFISACLLLNLPINLLTNLLVNLSLNSFQIVIYEHFCVCMDICWFTCMPVSFFFLFVHLSAYFHFVVST